MANDSEVSGDDIMPYRGNLSDDESREHKSKKHRKQ